MEQIGLTGEEIKRIVAEAGIRNGESATAESVQNAIAKAITENNQALLQAIKTIAQG